MYREPLRVVLNNYKNSLIDKDSLRIAHLVGSLFEEEVNDVNYDMTSDGSITVYTPHRQVTIDNKGYYVKIYQGLHTKSCLWEDVDKELGLSK